MRDRPVDKPGKRRGRPPLPPSRVRDRNSGIEVYVSEAERETIAANASQVGLSVSAFLRTLGQYHQPKPIADQATIAALVHLESRIALLSRQLEDLNIPSSDTTLDQLRQLCAKVSAMLDQ